MSYILRKERSLNYVGLSMNVHDKFLYCRYGNKFIFVVGNDNIISRFESQRYIQVAMEVIENIPMYKVAMNVQMGRGIETSQKRIRLVNLEIVECRDKNIYHDVYRLYLG